MSLTADMGMIAITIGGNQVAHQALVRVNDEIDRLRAQNEHLHEQLDTVSDAHNVMAKEDNRLRAENAELFEALQQAVGFLERIGGWPNGYAKARTILAKTAKEGGG